MNLLLAFIGPVPVLADAATAAGTIVGRLLVIGLIIWGIVWLVKRFRTKP